MVRHLLSLAAALLPTAAPASQQAAPSPQAAEWSFETTEGQRTLRGATAQHPGDRIIFLCNSERRLVAMLFRLGEDPEMVRASAVSGAWLVDGAAQAQVDPRPIIPMNRHIVSLSMVDAALFRRLLAAGAAGFVWRGADGTRLADYQLTIASGRAKLAEFGRACDAEAYR